MEPSFSPKAHAYIRASEIIKRSRIEPGMYDRKVAKAINAELQLVSKQLFSSAKRIVKNDTIKKYLEDHPDKVENYKLNEKLFRFVSARKRADKLANEITAATTNKDKTEVEKR